MATSTQNSLIFIFLKLYVPFSSITFSPLFSLRRCRQTQNLNSSVFPRPSLTLSGKMSVPGPTGSPPVPDTTPIAPNVSLPQPPVPLDSPAAPVADAPETSNVSSPPPPPPVVSDSPPGDTAPDPETSNASSPPPPSPVVSESPPGNTATTPNSSSPTTDSNSDPSSSSTPEAHLTTPSSTFSPPPPPSSLALDAPPIAFSLTSGGVSTAIVAGVVVGGVVLLVVLGVLLICCARKRKRENKYGIEGYVMSPSSGKGGQNGGSGKQWRQHNPASADYNQTAKQNSTPPILNSGGGSRSNCTRSSNSNVSLSSGMAINFSKSSFSYDELMMATNGFSDANLLGQGGFGYVHKGVLPNGKEVAVKSLKADEDQGDKEFQVEVETISRVHHKHLVTLVGYCITGPKRILVFEYVTNQTLEFHLHGRIRCRLDWPTRLKIALGAAKGLAYLHEDCHPKIIHRDIKAANILLDSNFEAKVADFGLAKMTNDANTHVSTRVMGTFGYLAPEYASSGKLTEKSDVFSFGVMLLELFTGRRPIDRKNPNMDGLVDWARPLIGRAMEDGNFDGVIDEQLEGNYNPDEIARMAACAISSVRHSARRRPKMSHIVRVLEGSMSLYELADGAKQGQSAGYSTSDYSSGQYREDMQKMMKTALESQDYGSGETGTTSEYGMHSSGSTSDSQGTQEKEMGKMRNNSRSYTGSNRRN